MKENKGSNSKQEASGSNLQFTNTAATSNDQSGVSDPSKIHQSEIISIPQTKSLKKKGTVNDPDSSRNLVDFMKEFMMVGMLK